MSTTSSATPSPQLPQLIPGSTVDTGFGLLKIGKFLGRGAFGSVHSAQLQAFPVPSALKILPLSNGENKAAKQELSFLQTVSEAQGKDYHLVDFHGCFSYGDAVCLLMEELGLCLFQYLVATQNKPFTIDQVMAVGSQLLTATRFLHSLGIVHTDIKPANVLLASTDNLQIKLADFGNAIKTENLATFTGMNCLQTLNYRSPEVLLGLELTENMDIWSIGCVLAELYTGAMLFPATTEHQLAKFQYELFGLPESAGEGLLTSHFYSITQNKVQLLIDPDLSNVGFPIQPDARTMKLGTLGDIVEYGLNRLVHVEEDLLFVEVLEEMLNKNGTERASARKCLLYEFFN